MSVARKSAGPVAGEHLNSQRLLRVRLPLFGVQEVDAVLAKPLQVAPVPIAAAAATPPHVHPVLTEAIAKVGPAVPPPVGTATVPAMPALGPHPVAVPRATPAEVQLEALRSRVEQLQAQLTESQAGNVHLTAELHQLRQEPGPGPASSQTQLLVAERDRLRRDLTRREMEVVQINAERNSLAAEKVRLAAQIADLQQAALRQQDAVELQRKTQIDYKVLREQLDRIVKDRVALREELERRRAGTRELEGRLAAQAGVAEQLEPLRQQLAAATREKAALVAEQLEPLRQQLAAATREKAALTAQLQQQAEDFKVRLTGALRDKALAEAKGEKSMVIMKERVTPLLAEKEAQLAKAAEELARLRQEAEATRQRLDQTELARLTLSGQLEQARLDAAETRRRQEQAEAARREAVEQQARNEGARRELQEQLQVARNEAAELRQKLERLEPALAEGRGQAARAEAAKAAAEMQARALGEKFRAAQVDLLKANAIAEKLLAERAKPGTPDPAMPRLELENRLLREQRDQLVEELHALESKAKPQP